MKTILMLAIAVFSILPITACSEKKNSVKITAEKPPDTPRQRSEPIFYNGKTYRLDFTRSADGNFEMSVGGMTRKQEKDAVAVATSSLRYFACKDSETGKLSTQPNYVGSKWQMKAHCA